MGGGRRGEVGELISSALQRCQEMPSTVETDLKDEFSFWAFFFSFNYLQLGNFFSYIQVSSFSSSFFFFLSVKDFLQKKHVFCEHFLVEISRHLPGLFSEYLRKQMIPSTFLRVLPSGPPENFLFCALQC